MAFVAVVDDNEQLLVSLRFAIAAEGHVVDTFADPLVALPKLVLVPPMVLILNGRMPGMHGIEFFLRFRELSRARVIFLSANASDIEERLLEVGTSADEYVDKPFSTERLIGVVNRLARSAERSSA